MIAALYDIHGNLPALEAVLGDVRDEGFDLVVIGGDVAPGPMVGACLEAIRSAAVPWLGLRGNGDNDVLAARCGPMPSRVPGTFHATIQWCADRLSDEDTGTIAGWMPTRALDLPGLGGIQFCHATLRDDNEIFTESTPEDRVAPAFDGVDAAVIVCGHTHIPFDRLVRGRRILNAGSVGMAFGDTAAQWLAVLDDDVEFRRTEYDLESAQARIDASGYPGVFDVAQPPSREEMAAVFDAAAI